MFPYGKFQDEYKEAYNALVELSKVRLNKNNIQLYLYYDKIGLNAKFSDLSSHNAGINLVVSWD